MKKSAENEILETLSEYEPFSWIKCAGQVTAFLANFERTRDFLTNIKTSAVPNPKIFVIEIIDCLSKIKNECKTTRLCQKKRKRNVGRK